MKKIVLSLISILMCSTTMFAETWTVGGVSYTVTRGTESYLGTSYHTLQQNITLKSGGGDQLKVFYSYTDLTNYDVAVEAVGAGSKLSNLNTVATMSGKTTSGTAVVGVNADFFTSACPSGMFANEGTVHKAFTGDGFSAICIDPNKVPYIGYLQKVTCWLYNQTTAADFGWSDFAAINTSSTTATNCGVGEQAIFYTPQYGSASGNAGAGGYAVQLKPVNGAKLTPGKYLTYEVVSSPSSGSVTIPSDGIVLYGKGSYTGTGVSKLKVGDKITVYLRMQLKENDGTIVDVATSDNGATKYVHNALGGSQMILCNGNVISSYANNAGDPSYDAPRTAVGYNADKSRLYLCVVDGRSSGWSNGCTVKMMGDIMKALGCSDALNFDGGGSSQFWTNTGGLINDAKTNNGGGSVRSVKNSLFITEIPGATLNTSVSSMSFATENNATAAKSATISGTNWRTNVSVALSGTNADQFTVSATSIAKASGSGAVTVTYKPTKFGSHSATLTITTQQYTNKTVTKTITLSGTNTEVVVNPPAEEPEEPETPVEPEPETPTYSKGLTLIWQNTTNVPGVATGGDIRFAAVSKDNLIANDKANNKIITINQTGFSNYFDPSAKLTEYYSKNIGTAIASDDAGNILVNTDFPNAGSGSQFAIISADLKNTYKLDLSAISGYTAARTDQVGRIRGNMLSSEGAYFAVTPSGTDKVIVVNVVNGAINTSGSMITNALGTSNATNSIAQPSKTTIAEMNALTDKSQTFVLRHGGSPSYVYYGWTTSGFTTKHNLSKTTTEGYTTNGASVSGFDWFKLDGKSYFIMPLSTNGNVNGSGRSTYFAIYNEDGNVVATWTKGQKEEIGAAMGSIIAIPNDEHSVFIYHFVPGTVAEKLCFATQDIVTGIADIVEAAEAPVEYYNLQGVRVMNPESGLYIKRQGNKITKVIL